MTSPILEYQGRCPICATDVVFRAEDPWLRDNLKCMKCNSVPRERALALVLEETRPDWRDLAIHECSPIQRGISYKIYQEAKKLVRSQFYPGMALGATHDQFRNEDLQKMTFADNSFDLFISLDVMEHIPEPEQAFKEIWRTLKPGGFMLSTWPVSKYQVGGMEYRAKIREDGSFEHLKPAEYHGNPVDPVNGSLVTVDYGYDTHQMIEKTAPFDVRVYRFADRTHGILGEYLDVFLCRKRAA